MALSLTTVIRDPLVRIYGGPCSALVGRAQSVAVDNGRALVLFWRDGVGQDLLAIDLLSGAIERLAIAIEADFVLGALGGEPVLASRVGHRMSAWLLSRPDRQVDNLPDFPFGLPVDGALWLGAIWHTDRRSAVGVAVADGELVRALASCENYKNNCERLGRAALEHRRLPVDCPSVSLYMLPLMTAIGAKPSPPWAPRFDFAAGGPDDIVFDARGVKNNVYAGPRGHLDGRTGAVVWIEAGSLRVLRGGWRPSAPWSPATHHEFPADDRARALWLCFSACATKVCGSGTSCCWML